MGRSSTTESRAAPTQAVILTFSGEAAGGDKEHRCLLKPQPKRVGHVYGSVNTTDTDIDSGKSPHCGCTSPLAAQATHNHNGVGSPFMSERMRRTTGSAAASTTGDGASFVGTVANLVKVCMGTGSLALPYAFLNGGLGFSIVGVVAIGVWNYVACEKLLACKALLDTHSHGADDIDSNSTYAFVGRKASGAAGAWMVHMSIVITLYGAGVMYLITAIGLLQDTPVSFLSAHHPGLAHLLNTAICVAIVLPLACARSVSFLAQSSLAGVMALAMAFAVIIGSAIWAGPQDGHQSLAQMWTVDVWPRDMQSLAKFFGIASFCFGLPPLLFQIQGSMQQPQHFSTAMQVAMAIVSVFYIAIAETVATLYSPQAPSNIIEVLPTSLLSTTVRLCVALVCLMSYPLAILPVGEMLDRTLEHAPCLVSTVQRRRLSFVPGLSRGVVGEGEEAWGKGIEGMRRVKQGTLTRVISRTLLVVSSAVCATGVPCFGMVVSLVGAFSVALVSFVLPPLFHLSLFNSRLTRFQALQDFVMFAAGLGACVFATWQTAEQSFRLLMLTHKCPS